MIIKHFDEQWWKQYHPEKELTPEEIYLEIERENFIASIIESLSNREEWVVLLKYGFLDDSPKIKADAERIFRENYGESSLKRIETSALKKIAQALIKERYVEKEPIIKKKRKPEEKLSKREELNNHVIELEHIIELAAKLEPYLIKHLKRKPTDLEKLPWKVFEELIAEFFASWGFEVEMFGRNPLSAADLLAIKKEEHTGTRVRYLIETKRWKDKVGVEVIDRVLGALTGEKATYGWHLAMIVTLAGIKRVKKYTSTQLSLLGVELKNKEHVASWLNDYKMSDKGLWLPKDFKIVEI